MFGFAAFSDAGFSAQTTSDATILAGAIVPVTTAGSLTSATGTTAQTVIALPATNVIASSIAGVTPETRVIATTAGSMTATVQAMGSEYTLKLIKIPETNLLTGSTGSPSLFTWVDVNDNVTAETWTDVETEDSTESWSNV